MQSSRRHKRVDRSPQFSRFPPTKPTRPFLVFEKTPAAGSCFWESSRAIARVVDWIPTATVDPHKEKIAGSIADGAESSQKEKR